MYTPMFLLCHCRVSARFVGGQQAMGICTMQSLLISSTNVVLSCLYMFLLMRQQATEICMFC